MDSSYTTETTTSSGGPFGILFGILMIILLVVAIAGIWRMYVKAGEKGWKSIIPFYNMYILAKICKRPGWWWLMLCLPLVNLVFSIFISLDLAKAFKRSELFAVLAIWFFSPIGYVILGFDSSDYDASGLPDRT